MHVACVGATQDYCLCSQLGSYWLMSHAYSCLQLYDFASCSKPRECKRLAEALASCSHTKPPQAPCPHPPKHKVSTRPLSNNLSKCLVTKTVGGNHHQTPANHPTQCRSQHRRLHAASASVDAHTHAPSQQLPSLARSAACGTRHSMLSIFHW